MREGRQDIQAPEPRLEESDPIPVQQTRANRVMLWIGVVALIFVAVIVIVFLNY
jgi:cytochrome c-type biogenesis protein CcmH/NrfG